VIRLEGRGRTTMMRLTILVKFRSSRPVMMDPIMASTSTSDEFISGDSGPK
jgi:hypothetical protein